jgi:hypothetical protein
MQRRGVLSGEFDPEVEEAELLNDLLSPEGAEDDLPDNAPPANVDVPA